MHFGRKFILGISVLLALFSTSAFSQYTTVNSVPQFASSGGYFSFYWAVWREMSEEELDTANSYILDINAELAIMYMIMPEEKYKDICDAIKLAQNINLIKCRNNLMVAMRKSQVPDTNFVKHEDIKSFKYLKKPSEKASD